MLVRYSTLKQVILIGREMRYNLIHNFLYKSMSLLSHGGVHRRVIQNIPYAVDYLSSLQFP